MAIGIPGETVRAGESHVPIFYSFITLGQLNQTEVQHGPL